MKDSIVSKSCTSNLIHLLESSTPNFTVKEQQELLLIVKEYYSNHWGDNDSPQSESTFGVCREIGLCLAS